MIRPMTPMNPEQVRRYLAGLKLRQLWTMMTSELFENDTQREAGVREVRDRWARLYRAVHA